MAINSWVNSSTIGTGYDCSSFTNLTTIIDLTDVERCKSSNLDVEIKSVYLQIFQKSDVIITPVIKCKVQRTRTLRRCAWLSDVQTIPGGLSKESLYVSESECRLMQSKGVYVTPSSSKVEGIKQNSILRFSTNEIGTVGDGTCKGVYFVFNGKAYSNVISEELYEIEVLEDEFEFSTKEETNLIKLGAKHSSQKMVTQEGYYVYWEYNPTQMCSGDDITLLFEGEAEKFEYQTGRLIWMVNTTTSAFAMERGRRKEYCGLVSYEIFNSEIFVLEIDNPSKKIFSRSRSVSGSKINLHSDLLARVIFVERHFSKELRTLASYLELKFCELKKSHYLTILSLAQSNPEVFVRVLLKQKGLYLDQRGALGYIFQCQEVSIVLRNTTLCYQSVPIKYNNESLFMNPISGIIHKHSEEMPCNPLAPTAYKFNDKWIETSPRIQKLSDLPLTLDPNSNHSWTYQEIGSMTRQALYTPEELEAYQEYTRSRLSSKELLRNFGKGLGGMHLSVEAVDMTNVFGEEHMANFVSHMFSSSMSSIWKVGKVASGLFGLYLLGKIVFIFLQFWTNSYVIYKKHGFSKKMLAAVSDHLTQVITADGEHKVRFWRKKRTNNDVESNVVSPEQKPLQPEDFDENSHDARIPASAPNVYPNLEDIKIFK